MSKENTVEQYFEALRNQNLAGIVALYSDDATVEDPVGTPVHMGKEAITEFYQQATAVKLGVKRLGDVRCAGDFAAFRFAITVPNANGPLVMEVIDTLKFKEAGKIVEMKAYWGNKNCKPVNL